MRWPELISDRLAGIRAGGRWRTIRTVDDGPVTSVVEATGQAVTGFASNDYLGLSHHPAVIAAAREEIASSGTGSGAARLIVGGRPVHDRLESAIAEWQHRQAALLFGTGYQANLGVLGALSAAAGPDCVILSDELNHASIIDGARLARASVRVYRHGDVSQVRELVADAGGAPVVVVTDAVFSMDGDLAPIDELRHLCEVTDSLLVVDEAHAVLGAGDPGPDAVVIGTLSKTLGSVGGFMAGSEDMIALCRNTARSFIFTTANAPGDSAAALAALTVLRSEEGGALVARLRANVERLRPGHASPIVAVLLGDEARAVEVADSLLGRGLLVPAIRPPTVAPGTCRLRIALSAVHTPEQIDQLIEALEELGFNDG